MTAPTPFEIELDEALNKHLQEIKAGHDDKLKQAIQAAHEAAVAAARMDELTVLSFRIPEHSEAGELIKERASILKAALTPTPEPQADAGEPAPNQEAES